MVSVSSSHAVGRGFMPCWDSLVIRLSATCGRSWVHASLGWLSGLVSASHAVGHGFVPGRLRTA